MISERFSMKLAVRAAAPWLIATILLTAPAAVAALGDGTENECGVAEPCAVTSPLPDSSSSAGARGTARIHRSSIRAADRSASRKARASEKKVAPSTPTLVATDASTARSANKRAESR